MLGAAAPYLSLSRHIREDRVKREKITQIESPCQPGSQKEVFSTYLLVTGDFGQACGIFRENQVFFLPVSCLAKRNLSSRHEFLAFLGTEKRSQGWFGVTVC